MLFIGKIHFCTVNLASILMTYVDSNTEIHPDAQAKPVKKIIKERQFKGMSLTERKQARRKKH